MNYIKLIFLIILISCKNNSNEEVINEYAFENISYKNYDLANSKKDNSVNKSKNFNKDSKFEKSKRDSIKKIINYNRSVRKELDRFYQTANYLPSTNFDHLKHLRKYSKIEQIDDKTNKPKFFIDHIIENYLENPEHKNYLTDRKLLKKLKNDMCDESYVTINDTLVNGKSISITIRSDKFDTNGRKISFDKKNNYISKIDGKYPFGAIYYNNAIEEITELSNLEIIIDGIKIETNIEEFKNLYNPNFCRLDSYRKIAEAYQDGNNIYIYLFGGENAGSYFSKLIFDIDKGYIGKIVTDYYPLSMYGSFHEKFVGY